MVRTIGGLFIRSVQIKEGEVAIEVEEVEDEVEEAGQEEAEEVDKEELCIVQSHKRFQTS